MKDRKPIISKENQRLKRVRSIRDGKLPEMLFIEGVRLAEEALRSQIDISEAFVVEGFEGRQRNSELVERLQAANVEIYSVPENIFRGIADAATPQGIILTGRKPAGGEARLEQTFAHARQELFVFLAGINNPSNLGAIFRTAEAAAVSGIVISTDSADAFSPKATRAAMGANFRVPFWEKADIGEVFGWAGRKGLITTAADINAERSYYETDWKKPRLLIFGSEAHGLSEEVRRRIGEAIYIPMENGVESLNLAVSAGIILFEARRPALG